MEVPILNLKAQYQNLQPEIESAVLDVMRSGHYILGPYLSKFENEAAEFLGAKHAIGCANGSDALYLALLALDVKPGDEVITTAFTYVATAEAISQIGAKPVFVDIDLDTFNIDPNKIEEKITKNTKAIIVVHLYGQACEMQKIMQIATAHNLKVVEDTAQAFGTKYSDSYVGTIGDIGTYSFYPTKNLSCAGDGGMLTTNSDQLAERLRRIRAHGSSKRYYHDEFGVNSRLDEVQAAILSIKLKHIAAWNNRRADIAAKYDAAIGELIGSGSDLKILSPAVLKDSTHIYHQYTIRVLPNNSDNLETLERKRNAIRNYLKSKTIASEIYYPLPLHMQKLYQYLGHAEDDFYNSLVASKSIFCLPIYPELTQDQVDHLCLTLISLTEAKLLSVITD